MYASSSYARSASTMNSVASSAIWIIVSLVLAIVGGIVRNYNNFASGNNSSFINISRGKCKLSNWK